MENYIQHLRRHISENRILFDEDTEQPCLDTLWWHYGETHSMSNAATKEGFRAIRTSLAYMKPEEIDGIISQIGCLCAEHERIAFIAGLRLGAQLVMELLEENGDMA